MRFHKADIDREATQKDHFCCRLMTEEFIIRISFYFAAMYLLMLFDSFSKTARK